MKYLPLLVVLAALVVNGEESKPKAGKNTDKPANTAGQANSAASPSILVVHQEASTGEQDSHAKKPESYFETLFSAQNLPNIALVIVTAITAWYIASQAKETANATKAMKDANRFQKESVESFKKRERASIRIIPHYEGLSDFREPTRYDIYEAGISINHYGPTHVTDVKGRFKLVVEVSENPPEMNDLLGMTALPQIIEAGSKPVIESTLMMVAEEGTTLEDIIEGKAFVHFFGFITYLDLFGEQRRTPFRYIWKNHVIFGEDEEGLIIEEGHWQPHGPEEDNRAI